MMGPIVAAEAARAAGGAGGSRPHGAGIMMALMPAASEVAGARHAGYIMLATTMAWPRPPDVADGRHGEVDQPRRHAAGVQELAGQQEQRHRQDRS
jgi:hypothetical protein